MRDFLEINGVSLVYYSRFIKLIENNLLLI